MLLAVLVVVLVGHVLSGPLTAGRPSAVTIAGPPRIGDCVLSAPDPSIDPDIRRLPVVFGPCSGVMAGEIVAVTIGRPARSDGAIGELMGTAGPCWEAAARYTGLWTVGGVTSWPGQGTATSTPGAPRWLPTLRVRGQRVTADALQAATGRDWSACMVRPEDLSVYRGSARDVAAQGAAPAPYGDCTLPEGDPGTDSDQCSRPHTRERLGWAAVPIGAQTPSALALSCRELAAQLLRRSDPTYAGVLEILVETGYVTNCSLAVGGSGHLSRSLIGIAGGPLPLTT